MDYRWGRVYTKNPEQSSHNNEVTSVVVQWIALNRKVWQLVDKTYWARQTDRLACSSQAKSPLSPGR